MAECRRSPDIDCLPTSHCSVPSLYYSPYSSYRARRRKLWLIESVRGDDVFASDSAFSPCADDSLSLSLFYVLNQTLLLRFWNKQAVTVGTFILSVSYSNSRSFIQRLDALFLPGTHRIVHKYKISLNFFLCETLFSGFIRSISILVLGPF